MIFLFLSIENLQMIWRWVLVISIATYWNPFLVFLAMIINTPIERGVYHYYRIKAQKKLKSMNHLKKRQRLSEQMFRTYRPWPMDAQRPAAGISGHFLIKTTESEAPSFVFVFQVILPPGRQLYYALRHSYIFR